MSEVTHPWRRLAAGSHQEQIRIQKLIQIGAFERFRRTSEDDDAEKEKEGEEIGTIERMVQRAVRVLIRGLCNVNTWPAVGGQHEPRSEQHPYLLRGLPEPTGPLIQCAAL